MAKHIHQFKRVNLTRNPKKIPYIVYKCQQPDCSTYYPAELVVGKSCECPRCGETFIMEKEHTELENPRCNACRRNNESIGTATA